MALILLNPNEHPLSRRLGEIDMYKRLSGLLLGFIVATWSLSGAQALPISQTHTITGSGPGSVGFTAFTVTSAGIFDIFTEGPTIDPQLYLFEDGDANGVLGSAALDPFLATNDDGCSFAQCGPAGAFSNSLINEIALAAGTYIAAVSDFSFTAGEARSGLNTNNLTGDVNIVIAAGSTDSGSAAAVLSTAVPEPASTAMLGLGLLAAGLMLRQRSRQSN
ncbi:MAG: DVUA0089 family protein [Geminicoccaceae bacterium]